MPVYEYRCAKCGYVFSLLRSIFARRAPTACPQCGSDNTERLVSRFGSDRTDDSCSSRGPFT